MAKFIVQHRRGDTEQWLATDIIPKDGELIIEHTMDDTYKLKIGDGKNTFASLPYVTSGCTKAVTLLASDWIGDASPYSQVVNLDCVTACSRIDLQPTPSQLASLRDNETSLVTENENKVVTVFAIGEKPIEDYTIQVTITEVVLDE